MWVTLNLVRSETPSLHIQLSKSSIMARVWFALLSFFLSNFQLSWDYGEGVHTSVVQIKDHISIVHLFSITSSKCEIAWAPSWAPSSAPPRACSSSPWKFNLKIEVSLLKKKKTLDHIYLMWIYFDHRLQDYTFTPLHQYTLYICRIKVMKWCSGNSFQNSPVSRHLSKVKLMHWREKVTVYI